jgi:hypothetical protein
MGLAVWKSPNPTIDNQCLKTWGVTAEHHYFGQLRRVQSGQTAARQTVRQSFTVNCKLEWILQEKSQVSMGTRSKVLSSIQLRSQNIGSVTMKRTNGMSKAFVSLLLLLPINVAYSAENEVLGEIQFQGASKVEKTAGVWVDGQYVGFVKELKGSKKILLLPGEHDVTVRQAGYREFSRKVVLEPGQKQLVNVAMDKDPQAEYPDQTAQLKIMVKPNRAAVFLEDKFIGFVDQFDGPGQWLLVAPGKHRVKITLPGYRTFETEVNLALNQKFELKTELTKGSILQPEPLLKEKGDELARSK